MGANFRSARQAPEGPRDVAQSSRPERPRERQPAGSFRSTDAPTIPALERLRPLAADQTGGEAGACLSLIRELSAADCRRALNLFRRWPTPERQLVQRAIARRWASLDPEEALEGFDARDHGVWDALGNEAARVWVRRDADAALARLSRPGGAVPKVLLTRYIIGALAETDPDRAAAYLLSQRQHLRDDNVFGMVAARWAESDGAAAVAWAASVPTSQARTAALNAAWNAWAQKYPATVATAIMNQPGTRFDGTTIRAVAGSWSKDNPRAAMAWIETLSHQADRDTAWAALSLDAQKLGPEAALRLLSEVPSDTRRAQVASQMASAWAREDPHAALEWAQRLPEGTVRNKALRPVLEEWANHDPAQAMAFLSANPTVDSKTELLRRVAASWSARDSEAALQWFQSLPSGNERDEVANQIARGLREVVEPEKSAQLLEFIDSPAQRMELVREVTEQWAATDVQAAAQWLAQLPDAASQVGGYHSIARRWAFEDRDATARWMETLPAGPARDSAIGAFVLSVDGYDPALATAWAAAIENPSDREKTIRSAFRRWLERDIPSARSWLQQIELTDSFRSELLQAAERP